MSEQQQPPNTPNAGGAPAKIVEGRLLGFSETGTEGAVWMIEANGRHGYDALEPICEGDQLTILDQLGATVWEGTISCDKKTGWRRYPSNPRFGQQCALGRWIHWVQRGFRPDDWAQFFIRPAHDRLRGVLVRPYGQRGDPRLGPEESEP